MKILILDDELVSRAKMEVLMSTFGKCITVQDGQQAILEFKRAWEMGVPFNLVTLDIEMPGISGEQVLAQIREYETQAAVAPEKRALIFMVTGLSGKEQVLKCLSCGCQDYIVKPFNIKIIQEKLRNFGIFCDPAEKKPVTSEKDSSHSRSLFDEILAKLKAGELQLPSFPSIPLKFRDLIKQGAPSDAIAELLKQDIAISSKLIRLSNSSFYRGQNLNPTIEAAIGRLGLSVTEQLVNVLSNRTMFKLRREQDRSQFEKLWTHSLACAHAAEIIAGRKGFGFKDEAFNMGLFHDIGRLCLFQIIADLSESRRNGEMLDSGCIQETLDLHHGRFGAGILGKWGFSKDFCTIAEFHHQPRATPLAFPGLWVVHLANSIAKSSGYTHTDKEGTPDPTVSESATHLKLDETAIHEIQEQVQKKIQSLTECLG